MNITTIPQSIFCTFLPKLYIVLFYCKCFYFIFMFLTFAVLVFHFLIFSVFTVMHQYTNTNSLYVKTSPEGNENDSTCQVELLEDCGKAWCGKLERNTNEIKFHTTWNACTHVFMYSQHRTHLWRWNTGTRCVTVDVVDGFLKDHGLLSEALQVLWAFLRAVMVLANLHVCHKEVSQLKLWAYSINITSKHAIPAF